MQADLEDGFAHECAVRDAYASRLAEFRPRERLLGTEATFKDVALRADMKTVDQTNALRVWEFKIKADYKSLGQILTYLAMERRDSPDRIVRAVLAAFQFDESTLMTNEALNLGIEMVKIPLKLRQAGFVPAQTASRHDIPFIPISLPAPPSQ